MFSENLDNFSRFYGHAKLAVATAMWPNHALFRNEELWARKLAHHPNIKKSLLNLRSGKKKSEKKFFLENFF